ncbi:uncharacterized protein LOC133896429 isoform X2 [Phragmites australis]|uniref:uncharacterized protein LOC133896429 isoform X2 n=1 Tax=Phragmites australis TaxID=29695 RepID=UPI002D773153|nr:uncharacterized protein LOC133896429 isoform X2 [Phragmites australis]
MLGEMAADSSMSMSMAMAFHQGQGLTVTSSSFYNHHHHHHMLSFQSNHDPTLMPSTPRGPRPTPATTSNATLFLPPSPANVTPTPSSLHGPPSAPKYKFVTGSPADWTAHELATLKEGLIRYTHEPNIMKYIKIAAMLPTRTIRDVALRCWWTPGKESRRRKPDEYYSGKNMADLKDNMATSTSVANIQMAPPKNVVPFSMSMHHPNLNGFIPTEVPVLDSATQHLLEENNQLLSQITANIETFKVCVLIYFTCFCAHKCISASYLTSTALGTAARVPPPSSAQQMGHGDEK